MNEHHVQVGATERRDPHLIVGRALQGEHVAEKAVFILKTVRLHLCVVVVAHEGRPVNINERSTVDSTIAHEARVRQTEERVPAHGYQSFVVGHVAVEVHALHIYKALVFEIEGSLVHFAIINTHVSDVHASVIEHVQCATEITVLPFHDDGRNLARSDSQL